mgnify:CR=1 FL=1
MNKIGDIRKCPHCKNGMQVFKRFFGFYNIWICQNKKCGKENLQEKFSKEIKEK